MTNKLIKLASLIFATLTFSALAPRAYAAPKLYFDQTSITAKNNTEFSVPIKIDAESNQVVGSDITINFASNDQELLGVDNGGYFSEFTWASSDTGRVELHAFSSSIYQTKTGSGTLATLKFKSHQDKGSSTISFVCTSKGQDTNIIDNSGQNIVNCSNLNQTLITYATTSTSPPPSPTPQSSPSPTNSPSNSAPVCASLSLNLTTSTHLPQPITLSCSGTDANNDITSATFNFGDGTTQTISQNISRKGTISTTHSYTKTGIFKPTCQLRDGQADSNSCTSSLTISSPAPTNTPKPSLKPSSTPTGKVLSLVAETPTPSPTPIPSEEPISNPVQKSIPTFVWWIIGFIIIAIIGYFSVKHILKSTVTPIPPADN